MPSYAARIALLKKIEQRRGSRALLYVTGDRQGMEAQIHPEVYDFFVNLLDEIGVVKKISLVLYTRGGITLAGWSIVNLIHQFCDEFEVIVPSKAHSTGTLMSLAAKQIVMTKQATLGPIDPSVNNALNPQIPGGAPGARVPVSVEAVNGFMELAKAHSGKLSGHAVKDLLVQLSNMVHPLVLGEVYRSKAQIQMLATKLLTRAGLDAKSRGQIVSFLCSESGSHDYTIHRREAKELGLQIEKPNEPFYKEIKALYDDFAEDMQLTKRWDPNIEIGQDSERQYVIKRCIIETTTGGSHSFQTEGKLEKKQQPLPPQPPGAPQPPAPPMQLKDNRTYEGWKYELAPKQI